MGYKLPNGAYYYVEDTPNATKPFTALSNAENAVATLAAGHGVVEGDDVVLFSAWGDVDGLTARAIEVAENEVTLGGIDTSDLKRFRAGGGLGSLRVVKTNWVQIDQNLNNTMSGGEMQYRTISPLERDTDIQLPTSRTPRALAVTLGDDIEKAWHPVLLRADKSRAVRAIKLQLRDGAAILYSGVISYDGVPTVTKNEEMTVMMNVAITGTPLRYSADE